MHNLFRLSSRSSLEGYYYKPRADRELLHEYAKGLIGTTGCPSGEIQTWLRIGDYDKARASAAEFQDIFGKENFFLELMDHGLDIETRVREGLLQLRKDLDLPVIATNDSHYVHANDRDAHDALLCVGLGSTISDPKRMKFEGDGYYIKSAEEMRSLWEDKHDLKEACDNTLLIAERCQVGVRRVQRRLHGPRRRPRRPHRGVVVRRGGVAGHRARATAPTSSDEVRARTEMELQVIRDKGYCGYYLVVADFINWAKDHGIRVGPGPRVRRRLHRGVRLAHHRPLPAAARPDLRAVPQPRAPVHARLRHRLRRASARRGHPVRQRQVRLGAGRADRHVRPAQVQGRHQGRQPRARLPVRDGRAHHQGAAGRRHGQGRHAQGAVRPPAQALQRRPRVPRAARERRRGPQDLRHRGRPRGPDPPVGRARRRRHHEQRAAASTSCRS